jgi:hypothetical protein
MIEEEDDPKINSEVKISLIIYERLFLHSCINCLVRCVISNKYYQQEITIYGNKYVRIKLTQ